MIEAQHLSKRYGETLAVDDIKAMTSRLRNITRSVALADPKIKAAAYAEHGITVTYHQEGRALLESHSESPYLVTPVGIPHGNGTWASLLIGAASA